MAKQWTQKEIDKLKSLKNKDLTYKEMAAKMKRTQSALKLKASELGLTDPINYYSSEEIKSLKQMVADGFSDREIAEKLSRSHNSITSKRKKLGIKKKVGTWSKQEIQKLKSMLNKGYETSEIANRLKRNFISVSNKARELNFKVEDKENKKYKVIKNCLLVLKIIGENKKVNRKDLAEICNVHPRTISRYLNILHDVGYDIKYNRDYSCYELNNEDSKLNFLDVRSEHRDL